MRDYCVIDVRDDDWAGGNIKGSHNSPSSQFYLRVNDLVEKTKHIPTVVFHCALSQMRYAPFLYDSRDLPSSDANHTYPPAVRRLPEYVTKHGSLPSPISQPDLAPIHLDILRGARPARGRRRRHSPPGFSPPRRLPGLPGQIPQGPPARRKLEPGSLGQPSVLLARFLTFRCSCHILAPTARTVACHNASGSTYVIYFRGVLEGST